MFDKRFLLWILLVFISGCSDKNCVGRFNFNDEGLTVEIFDPNQCDVARELTYNIEALHIYNRSFCRLDCGDPISCSVAGGAGWVCLHDGEDMLVYIDTEQRSVQDMESGFSTIANERYSLYLQAQMEKH